MPRRMAFGLLRAVASVVAITAGLYGQDIPDAVADQIARIARFGHRYDVPDSGLVALSQAVRDAANDRSVAIVASHPDDQYVLLAAYLRFRLNWRVDLILFTRGEGGQNSRGPEVGDALGQLRTLETEACAARLGSEVWYLNRPDDGYCRTAEEALERWVRTSTIDDLARILREIRPDAVLTLHHEAETHGHDLALLEVLPRAVERASDPDLHAPGLPPVEISRLFKGASLADYDFKLPPDQLDPDRGSTYRQLAYAALTAEHRSQAPFRPIADFFDPYINLTGVPLNGRSPIPTLQEGLPDLFDELGRILESDDEIAALRKEFEELRWKLQRTRELVQSALRLRHQLLALHAPPGSDLALRLGRRVEALERIVQHGLGMQATVELEPGVVAAVPGETLRFKVTVYTSGLYGRGEQPRGQQIDRIELLPRDGHPLEIRSQDFFGEERFWRCTADFVVPEAAAERTSLADLFRRRTYRLPLTFDLKLQLEVDGLPTQSLSLPLELPIDVRPAVELEVMPNPMLVPDGREDLTFSVRVRCNTAQSLHGSLRVTVPPGFVAEPPSDTVDMRRGESLRDYSFTLRVPDGLRQRVRPVVVSLGRWSTRVPLHRVSVSVTEGLRVGLVSGVDDTAATILRELGVDLVLLGEQELPTRNLDDLDTILVDIRALRHHKAARAGFNRLIDFAEAGGRLVVFYHKDTEFDPERGLGGYPSGLELHIGKGRVTREDAPVTPLLPEHVLLNVPNKIRAEDWDAWVQERGLYFPDRYSDSYEEVLAMADPGEPEEHGSLLYARAGQGEFIYCALALYRQMRNLHPGACRLFANLVSRPSRSSGPSPSGTRR